MSFIAPPHHDPKQEEIDRAWKIHLGSQAERTRRAPHLDNETLIRLAGEQNWRCCYCGEPMAYPGHGKRHARQGTFEHVRPRCYGGTDSITNIAIACGGCNSRRGNFMFTAHYEALRA